jgi:hypothetical protein
LQHRFGVLAEEWRRVAVLEFAAGVEHRIPDLGFLEDFREIVDRAAGNPGRGERREPRLSATDRSWVKLAVGAWQRSKRLQGCASQRGMNNKQRRCV